MKRTTPFGAPLAVALLGLFVTPLAQAQTLLADIAGDYATTGTPIAASGTGTWNYYASTLATAGTLTALTYGPIGSAGSSGYGFSGDPTYGMPGLSPDLLFPDGAIPAGNQLAWHSGNGSPSFTVLRWTAGAGEAGTIRLEGEISKVGEPYGTVDFFVFVNGVQSYAQTAVGPGNFHAFDFTASITTGQFVDFVLGPGLDGYGGDESLISGTISAIPEPSTYAALAGLGALGLVLLRKRQLRKNPC